jgi:type II secretory pathway pseudopilin PulG
MKQASLPSQAQRDRRRQGGLVLLALLLTLQLGAIATLAGMEVWATTRQREREQQLLFVGDQYRRAIRSYYMSAPAGRPRVLPASLEDLLADDRFPTPVRHLRRLYPDPITGSNEWHLIYHRGRILGVASASTAVPLKRTGFSPLYWHFEGKTSYREWEFLFAFGGPFRR